MARYIRLGLKVLRSTTNSHGNFNRYQCPTKHADRLPVYYKNRHCPPNIWIGVSSEDKTHGLPRNDWVHETQDCVVKTLICA